VIICGDVCLFNHKLFGLVERQSNPIEEKVFDFLSRWKTVYLIPGNHDWWGIPESKVSLLSDVLDFSYQTKTGTCINVVNNCVKTVGQTKCVFSTLWTEVITNILTVFLRLNDYRRIPTLTVRDTNDLNRRSKLFLRECCGQLAVNHEKCCMFTHHIPLQYFLNSKYSNSNIDEAYANSLGAFIEEFAHVIKLWAFGHTHTAYDETLLDTHFICNPFGYPGEHSGFDYGLVIDL